MCLPTFAPEKFNSVKRWWNYMILGALLSSCNTLKQVMQPHTRNSTAATGSGTPVLLENIEIKQDKTPVTTKSTNSGKTSATSFKVTNASVVPSIEMVTMNQIRFALRLDVPVEFIQNRFLYDFIDQWWNAPYRLGGTSINGIDCSAFVQTLMASVFALQLPRTTKEQYSYSKEVSTEELKEGDLVFFRTSRRGISHVGVYLQNNKFVHASTSGGVMISDLAEQYWSQRYLFAGRVLQSEIQKP